MIKDNLMSNLGLAACLIMFSVLLSACAKSPVDTIEDENYLVGKIESLCGEMPYSCNEPLSCEGKSVTFDAYVRGYYNVFAEDNRFLILIPDPSGPGDKLGSSEVRVTNGDDAFYERLRDAARNNSSITVTGNITGFTMPTNDACTTGIYYVADAKDILFE